MGVHDLLPNGDDGTGWGVAAGTRWQLQDDGYTTPDDAGTAQGWDGVNDSENRFQLTPMRSMIACQGLSVYVRYLAEVANNALNHRGMIKLAVGGSFYGTYLATRTDGLWDTVGWSWENNPATGKPFTKDELDSLIAGVTVQDLSAPTQSYTLSFVVVRVQFTPAPTADAPRKRITRALRASVRPTRTVDITAPIILGDARMLHVLPMSHPDGQSGDGQGWGEEVMQRRPLILTGRRYDPARYQFSLTALDPTPSIGLYSFYRSLRSKSPAAATLPGVGRSDGGALDSLIRNGRAWVETRDGRVIGTGTDEFKTERRGTLFEPERENSLLRSAFINGVTGLTAIGTAGQSTADTTDLMLDKNESGNSLKIVANGAADQGRLWPATAAFAANDILSFSADVKNDSGIALYWYLQRSTDSKYLRAIDWTWQVGIQYNAFPVQTARSPKLRYKSAPFVIDTTGSPTATLSIVHKSTDANGSTSHVYHVQLEKGTWVSSRKVTDAATTLQPADKYVVTSMNPPHLWPILRGTLFVLLATDWDSATVATGGKSIMRVNHDGAITNQQEDVTYNVGTGSFRFSRTINNVVHRATFTQAVTRGTPYVIACRWVSDRGELGLLRGQTSVFVNGVRGTDNQPTQGAGLPFCPVPGATIPVGIGCNPNVAGQEFGGSIAEILVTPIPLPDSAIADYSAYLLASYALVTSGLDA